MDKQKKELSIAILLCSVYLTVLCTENLGAASTLSPSTVFPACTTLISNQPTNKPIITIEHPTANLGKVRPNKEYICSFPFKNTGNALLQIKGIQSTCQCSTPKLEKKKYTPGESGAVIVHFLSPPIEGNSVKHIYVLSNDPEAPRAKLAIKATVVLPWDIMPQRIKLDCRKADLGIVPITIRSRDGKPFRISRVVSPDNAITASFDPAYLATEHVIHPKVNIDAVRKRNSGRITIEVTHPEFRILSVPYAIQPEFDIFPRRVIFFNAIPGKEYSRQIAVTNNYGEDFKITLVKSLKGHMKVLGFERENATAKVTVECLMPESATPGYFSDDIEIRINESRVYRVPCNVWIGGKH